LGSEEQKIKGTAEQVKGKVQEGVGKMTGDKETEARGKAEQMKGKARETMGQAGEEIDKTIEKGKERAA
jgi:uncharacterized protein YjbJ (UPF0337 family)